MEPHALALDVSKGKPLWDAPRGKVIRIDERDRKVMIDKGSRDGIRTGLTFNVFGAGPNDKAEGPFKGTIEVNREHPEQSSVSVSIDPASIDTGIAKRDEHLRSGLFEVARFPEITFKSRRVKQTAENSGEIVGDLTMHGVTREIVLKVEDVSKTGTRFRVTTPPLKRSQLFRGRASGVSPRSRIARTLGAVVTARPPVSGFP